MKKRGIDMDVSDEEEEGRIDPSQTRAMSAGTTTVTMTIM